MGVLLSRSAAIRLCLALMALALIVYATKTRVADNPGPFRDDSQTASDNQEAEPEVAPKGEPISQPEATAFADAIADAAARQDMKAINKLIDWKRISKQITINPATGKVDPLLARVMRASGYRLPGSTSRLFETLFKQIAQGATYKCLRTTIDDPKPYAIFRLLTEDGSVGHHRWSLTRGSGAKVVADDLYLFQMGEHISGMARRAFLVDSPLSREASGFQLTPADELIRTHSFELKEFTKNFTAGNLAEAGKIYRAMPAELRRDKYLLLAGLQTVGVESEKELLQLIDDFQKLYPNDAALDSLLMSSYRIRGQYQLELGALERLNEKVGGDPFLLTQKGDVLLMLQRIPEARKVTEEAIRAEPDLIEGYSTGLRVSLADQNFEETVKYLTILDEEFESGWADLREEAGFEEFVKSGEYLKWMETQSSK